MLVKTYDGRDLKREFEEWDRDYFTLNACEEIVSLFEEASSEPQELDIIGLCGDFTEATKEDILFDYGYMLELGEDWEQLDNEEQMERLTDLLSEHTIARRTSGFDDNYKWNEYILYMSF